MWETRTAQFNGIWNYFLMQVCAWMEFTLLISGNWLLKCSIFFQPIHKTQRESTGRPVAWHIIASTPTSKPRLQFSTTILNYAMSIVFPQTWSLLNLVRCSTSLKIMKQWSRWSLKAEVQQRDMKPEPAGVALDWLFDRINLDRKIRMKYVDTKHQLADILTKSNFTRDEWNNRLCLFNISHFSILCCSQKFQLDQPHWNDGEKDATRTGEARIVAKSKPTLNLVSKTEASLSTLLSPNASNRPGILRAPCQQGLILQESTEKTVARDSNQNDAASISQAWQKDAEKDERTRRLVALKAENSESIDGNDRVWPHNFHIPYCLRSTSWESIHRTLVANRETKWKISV